MKTGGARRLWVRVPRLPPEKLKSGKLKVETAPRSSLNFPLTTYHFPLTKSCGPAAKAAALQAEDRRFESVQDYYQVSCCGKPLINKQMFSGCRKAWPFRRFWEPKIAGSNPAILTSNSSKECRQSGGQVFRLSYAIC